jgi:flagellar biosynthetic protein FliR
MPLVGTLFAYAAAAVFFSLNGHVELLRFFAASLDTIPLGSWEMPHSIARLTAFMSVAFLSAFGVAGGAVLALFLVDMSVALMSRTIPQMNVLILGFQTKTLVLLLVLPTAFGIGGVVLVRMMAMVLRALPGLL